MSDGGGVDIRTAEVADAEGLAALTAAVAAERRYIVPDALFFTPSQQAAVIAARDPAQHQIWVGVFRGRVVAELEAVRGVWPKTAHTATVAVIVAKEQRGRGVFRRALAEAVRWAGAVGVEKLCLSVFSSNTGAIAAYRRMGFQAEGVRRGQFRVDGESVDEVLMALWIKAD
jgi:RimJ/RimL family protein N-acetyltransferase